MKKNILHLAGLVCFGITIISCSSSYNPAANPNGFLPKNSLNLMRPVPTDNKDIHAFVYRNPGFRRSDYDKLIVESVTLYQHEIESRGITKDMIVDAQASLTNDLKTMLEQKIPLTTTPGSRVAKLNVAITGAMLEGDGFKPRYLLPISAAMQLVQHATNLQNKKPILIIETRVVNSETNELLSSSATEIGGGEFRLQSSESGEFKQVAKKWVQDAMKYAFSNPANQQ